MSSSSPSVTSVLYGGAHRFSADTPNKLGRLARAACEQAAPDAIRLAHAVGLKGAGALPRDDATIAALLKSVREDKGVAERMPVLQFAIDIHARLMAKLDAEPLEDLRIDFEDGLGPISADDEQELAAKAGADLAAAVAANEAPKSVGLRPKGVSVTGADAPAPARCAQTLEAFLTAYKRELDVKKAAPHPHFVVTLPKVESAAEVEVAADILERLEIDLELPRIHLEVMVESAAGLWDDKSGALRVPSLVRAGGGRVIGLHFGTYDYSASVGIPAPHQRADHPACDLARHLLVSAAAPFKIVVSDGATHEMPIGPHRAIPPSNAPGSPRGDAVLDEAQVAENRRVVEGALRLHAEHVATALANGMPMGWDLHPTQLIARYAATFAFYRRPLKDMTRRMRVYVDREAAAALTGSMFDDAASAAGVRVFFERGHACGAIDDDEMRHAGLGPNLDAPAATS